MKQMFWLEENQNVSIASLIDLEELGPVAYNSSHLTTF
jgi:hypothetical protein|tara:strand:- start:621 stop:734 length:114 start_codon:yes stop_codon:yes gene_type:complete